MIRLRFISLGFLIAGVAPAAVPGSFLEQHCYDCHDAETRKGDLDLTALTLDARHLDLLIKVHDAVERGDMPPREKKQPAETAKAAFVRELETKLMAMTAPAPGGRIRWRWGMRGWTRRATVPSCCGGWRDGAWRRSG